MYTKTKERKRERERERKKEKKERKREREREKGQTGACLTRADALLGSPEAWLVLFWGDGQTWTYGQTDKRTDVRNFSPILQDFVPCGGHCLMRQTSRRTDSCNGSMC